MTRRTAVTGAPGAGRTTLVAAAAIARPDVEVVAEAATAVNDELLDAGHARPERQPDFGHRRLAALTRRPPSCPGLRSR